MAGHSKFKNIQHRKGAQDKKRAKVFTKLVREIITAAKVGSSEPQNNPRLRNAISAARSENLPKDRIDKAISSASDSNDNQNYTEIRYEGFAPNGIAIIVEALTDNRNRTASDVRSAFTKFGGNLGETGSVSYLFTHCGVISYPAASVSFSSLFDEALELGASDVVFEDESHHVYTNMEDFSAILESLSNKFGVAEESYIGWIPHDTIMVHDKDQAEKIFKLVDLLEESDDVQKVFGNYELSDELYEIMK